jgi:hypothetical protein
MTNGGHLVSLKVRNAAPHGLGLIVPGLGREVAHGEAVEVSPEMFARLVIQVDWVPVGKEAERQAELHEAALRRPDPLAEIQPEPKPEPEPEGATS